MNSPLLPILSSTCSQEEKEIAFLEMQKPVIRSRNYDALCENIINIKNFWSEITTSRIIKIIRKLFSLIQCDNDLKLIIPFLNDLIDWATKTNRNLLRLDLECKRIYVYIYINKFHEALTSIKHTIKDLKKFDDKTNLIMLYVYESKAYYKIKNFSKAKSSLTSARSLAVSCYCSYELQAQIDLFNGMYLCDSRNYQTACSYFIEAVEGFRIDKNDELCRVAFRYLLLSNILKDNGNLKNKSVNFEHSLSNNKKNKFSYDDDNIIQILNNVKVAIKERSLKKYLDILENNKIILDSDEFLNSHLKYLYDILLEANIIKIIEAYSIIYLKYIADDLGFDVDVVEVKIRKMILDGSINGIIDHNDMSLILSNKKEEKQVCNEILEKISKIISN
ncbi:26s proteasome non-atpase regulatory subunit 11 [Vairimorpha apis BRL 01]|uniref:26s proteasome non-atpase regulatory subunit 11 n=1 Tax=Vairimorpha apis BRL 01 TaxID=1037528 RepID=T0L4K3_9MICR|nr:26s proteasome non-atpase regulatory subunit 11 [Vairimorpha apis BRL 01]